MFVKHHAGWTYADYDAAAAGDIALDAEFGKVEAAFMEQVKKDKAGG